MDAMQTSIYPSPFVRFALSVLVARSGTLLSRVFIVACATIVGVLAISSGLLASALVPRLLSLGLLVVLHN